jgi:hypothetical protein
MRPCAASTTARADCSGSEAGDVTERNARTVMAVASDFQTTYDPAFAWKTAVNAVLELPGLRGFWPMSAFDSAGNAQDQSGHGKVLTYNGGPTYNVQGLAPYIDLDGANDWLDRADEADLDITGTEAYVAAGKKGLTFGGWFYVNALTGLDCAMSKYDQILGNDRSYAIFLTGANAQAAFTQDGTAGTLVTVNNGNWALTTWQQLVFRFTPSTSLDMWVNDTVATQGHAHAHVFSGAADFMIGAYLNGAVFGRLNGHASMCWLCASLLSDTEIKALWSHTRALYGV